MNSISFGIVGACGRGGTFKYVFEALEEARIVAVCDVNALELPDAAERLGAAEQYTDYDEMLESDIDAVVLGTPMPFHVPQAIRALQAGKHVLSEVPAGVSVSECRELVGVCKRTRAKYMMAENYTYTRSNTLVRALSEAGLFGTPYYAEGEYIHELKELNEVTRWRRKWQTGIDGITYPTHSLGPVLQWMPGDRVASVCCQGSGHHYVDPRGDQYENQDSCVMLCKMASGGLVKIRVDMLSDRPHAMTNYSLQGTDGCYESARASGDRDRIWLRAKGDEPNEWLDLESLADAYLPQRYRELEELAKRTGHGGGDFFVVADFCRCILEDSEPEVGIHQAMDMTVPGFISQQSIAQGGCWLDVPDTREW